METSIQLLSKLLNYTSLCPHPHFGKRIQRMQLCVNNQVDYDELVPVYILRRVAAAS